MRATARKLMLHTTNFPATCDIDLTPNSLPADPRLRDVDRVARSSALARLPCEFLVVRHFLVGTARASRSCGPVLAICASLRGALSFLPPYFIQTPVLSARLIRRPPKLNIGERYSTQASPILSKEIFVGARNNTPGTGEPEEGLGRLRRGEDAATSVVIRGGGGWMVVSEDQLRGQ